MCDVLGGSLILVASWNIKNVELAAGRWLCREFLGWVVRDVVAINNVVVPVSLTEFESRALEAESAFP